MKRNAIEWAVLATSIVAIGLIVVILAVEGVSERRPADPRIELDTAQARMGAAGWIVPATVVNAGDEAAEAVVFEAAATVGGEPETSELEVDFLPAGTEVEIAFAFSDQPEGEITVRLVSFRSP